MKDRKTIAVLITQPEEQYQGNLISGISKRAYELDYDVAVFATCYKIAPTDDIKVGAANIFSLINLKKIDAMILVPDTIKDKAALDYVVNNVAASFTGPMLSIDLELPGIANMSTDDASVIEKLCDHLIDHHGVRIIDFMQGFPEHEHSVRRLEGYKRSLKKHGIDFEPERVHDGDFWYFKGEDVANEILSSELERPQAVMCAADTMAISLCDAFKKRGISVPDDIIVTGYDSNEEGRSYVPSITSAHYPAANTGVRAVNYLHSALTGEEYAPLDASDLKLYISKSCGCKMNISDMFLNDSEVNAAHDPKFASSDNLFMSDLISRDSIKELMGCIHWYTYQIRPFTEYLLVLNEDWMDTDSVDSDKYRKYGYSDRVRLRLQTYDGIKLFEGYEFDRDELIPDEFILKDRPATYYFIALNYADRSFGYEIIVIDDAKKPVNPDFRVWTRSVCDGLECLRRLLHLSRMYDKIKYAAETDTMTGLFNRNAFNRYVDELQERSKREPINIMFLLADINYLKTINDTFGHLAGDEAIKLLAKAIKNSCGEDERCFRFGGDEFIIIGVGRYDEERMKQMKDNIYGRLNEYNKKSTFSFNVDSSMGSVYAQINAGMPIDNLVRAADEMMYVEKKKRHQLGNIFKVS